MMTDDKLGDRIARGKRAELLLNNPIFEEAMTDIEESLMSGWMATKAEQTDIRERCWQALTMLGRLRQTFQTYVANGRLAQGDLDRMLRDS